MAIDPKDVKILASNVLKVLMKTCFTFLKERPIALCTLLSFILVYILFPSMFWYFIYSLPFVVFIVISIKIYTSGHKPKENKKDENGNDSKSCRKIHFDEDGSRKYNSFHARSVRRRRAMETISENYTESSSLENYTPGHKSVLEQEEKAKAIEGVEIEPVINASQGFRTRFNGDSSSTGERVSSTGGVETEGMSAENTEDEEDENTRGDEREAVLWTEDDEKNLMDLGISEMERNKRLENLIARRRSRKMWSLQVRKALLNKGGGVNEPPSNIASLMIPRHNTSVVENGPFSPTPGSAPSVLLPTRNPFDLPYEPHEEKPNLTGDSFHQEFMVAHYKDMMLCRHESFRAFLPVELRKNLKETSMNHDHGTKQVKFENTESSETATTRPPDQGNDDKIIKEKASQEAEPDLKVKNTDDHVAQVQDSEQGPVSVDIHQTKSEIVEDHSTRSRSPSSSSSDEEEESFHRIDKDAILKSLSSPAPRHIASDKDVSGRIDDILHDYDPSVAENTIREGSVYYEANTMHHTPSHSIASDLQVEVSEFGSPTRTSDWNISSLDEEEEQSQTEDPWVASSRLSGVDENESRSKEIREVREEEIIGVGFSRINDNSGFPIASSPKAERVTDRNSENETPEECEANTTSEKYNNVHEHQASTPELLQASTSQVPAFPLYEEVQQQSEVASPPHLPCTIEFENLEAAQDAPAQACNSRLKSSNGQDGESFQNMTTSKQADIQACTEQGGNQIGESSKPTSSEEIPGLLQTTLQHEEIIASIQDDCLPESTTINAENDTHSADPPEMELVPETGDVQVSTATLSSTLSPKSVLQPSFSMDQSSESYLTQEVQMEIQQSERHMMENHTVDERGDSPLSSTPIESAVSQVEDRNAETIQDPSTSMTRTEETNSIQSANELVVHDEKMQTSEPNEFVKDTSGRLRSHETVAELEKPTMDTNSNHGKNDETPANSTAYSNTADQRKNTADHRKNFDKTLNNEQDKMMQLAFSFWTNMISGTEENQ